MLPRPECCQLITSDARVNQSVGEDLLAVRQIHARLTGSSQHRRQHMEVGGFGRGVVGT